MADGQAYNVSVELFREYEYPMLKDNIYLDHAGTTLYSKSLVDCFTAGMMANLLGNPHSASASSQAASQMIEDVRLQTLQFFGADPNEFDLVFVANATAGIKLVVEAFRALPGGFSYIYHQACHTSLVGVREEAQEAACLPSGEIEQWISGHNKPVFSRQCQNTLFAYPAQSNMDGQRFPMSWAGSLRGTSNIGGSSGCTWTLLDAAAYAATSPLDLSDPACAPDFTVVSFYKIFGFPDLGGLIVRRQAEPVFDRRRYFGGGTVDMVVCSPREQWHASKTQSLHDRLEDGTLPVHSISALGKALQAHATLFGSMKRVSAHCAFLADRLYMSLTSLRHHNNAPVCHMYSPPREIRGAGATTHGPVVSFNLQNSQGAWVSLTEFDKLAALKRFHVRTGSVCNPGGVAAALQLEPWEMRYNFLHGLRCGSEAESDDIVSGKPTGIIRISLAAMSTVSDVDRFVAFIDEFYREPSPPAAQLPPTSNNTENTKGIECNKSSLYVSSISVYPIKSCGAFAIPRDTRWEVRSEGLAWDREWCLVHRGTRRALSQKQYPQMVLLRPVLDFEQGVLRVSYAGKAGEVSVPLSHNPAVFLGSSSLTTMSTTATTTTTPPRSRESRVCGEEIAAQVYTCSAINDFFSGVLGVPCLLARFPPGGQGKSVRHAKAHLQKHQALYTSDTSTHPPSPPDSDSERSTTSQADASNVGAGAKQRRILLSNESPILAINAASLRALNEHVRELGSTAASEIPASVFRANVVLDSRDIHSKPYAEDDWCRLRIGHQSFKMMGSCRRCHMVCINQETGSKSEEPFVTLTKTRRFDGKVFFGTHMGHESENTDEEAATPEMQFPTIAVGDTVTTE